MAARGAHATGGTLGIRVRLDGAHAIIGAPGATMVHKAESARVVLTRGEAMALMAELAEAVAEHDLETEGRRIA